MQIQALVELSENSKQKPFRQLTREDMFASGPATKAQAFGGFGFHRGFGFHHFGFGFHRGFGFPGWGWGGGWGGGCGGCFC